MGSSRSLVALLVAMTLLVAACGSGDDGESADDAGSGNDAATTSEAPPSTDEATTTTEESTVPETSTTTDGEPGEDDDEGEGSDDGEAEPVDYLTYGAGAFPVRFDPETQGAAAAAILDGLGGYDVVADSPTGPDEPITVTIELPAETTFETFAVAPQSSFGCCSGTHIDTVTVEGSDTSPDEGYEQLAQFQVDPEIEENQEFPVDVETPVRWVRVTLEGRQVPDPEDYRPTAFTELLGYGTQEEIEVPDGTFTGRWLTGGGAAGDDGNRIELIQNGTLITGCGIAGGASYTVSGGIENGLLKYVVGEDTVPAVAVINSEDQLVGATIGRSFTRIIGEPGGGPTPCSPGEDPPPNPVGQALDECRAAIVYGINFDVDRDEIRPDAEPALDQILEALTSRPDLAAVIEGHTDADGSDEYNLDLSQRRAESVVAWLTDRGVDPSKLTAAGVGEAEPIADNETSAGKASNRRVEVEPVC